MKTRIIHTKIWQDEWFCSLPRASRFIFIYLISCPQNNICGIFELPDRQIVFDTGVTREELEQAKKDLAGRVIFMLGWVKLIHSDKYNNYVTNDKMQVALQKELNIIPEEIKNNMNEYDTSIDTSIYTPNNHKSIIINNKSVNTLGSIDCLTKEVCGEIATQYNVSQRNVQNLAEDLRLYCESKGKRYANYKSALQGWVRRAVEVKKISKIAPAYVEPEPDYDPVQAALNLEKLREMKNDLLNAKSI